MQHRLARTDLIDSLQASRFLKASMQDCSWKAGWRSLLLRSYVDAPVVDELRTPATADQLIVLVTGGRCDIQARYGRQRASALYGEGAIGMTGPGDEATLSWKSDQPHSTLQLHLPAQTLRQASTELSDAEPGRHAVPSALFLTDPVIRQLMLSLSQAMTQGAPDLYAETAAQFLAVHLLVHYGGARPSPKNPGVERVQRADDYLRAHLGTAVTLEAIAREAGLSRFHLLRLFKQVHGETPMKRLTRLRMEHAQSLLAATPLPITQVAFQCGYETPAHFALAFRRFTGMTPSAYRR